MQKLTILFLLLSSFILADTPCIDFGQRETTLENKDFAWFFRRGDVNWDNSVDISDCISILNYLFSGTKPPCQLDAADVNDDETINIADGIFILSYLFGGDDAPSAPFLNVGVDFTPPNPGVTGLQDHMDHDYNNDGFLDTEISNGYKVLSLNSNKYFAVNVKKSKTLYDTDYMYDTPDGGLGHLVDIYSPDQVEFTAHGNNFADYYSVNTVCTGVGFGKQYPTSSWNPSPAGSFLHHDWAPSVARIIGGMPSSLTTPTEWIFTPLFRFELKSTPSSTCNNTMNIAYFGPSKWFDSDSSSYKPKIKVCIGAFYGVGFTKKRQTDIVREFQFSPADTSTDKWGIWQVYKNTASGGTNFCTDICPVLKSSDWEHNYSGFGYYKFDYGILKNLCKHNKSLTTSNKTILNFPGEFISHIPSKNYVDKNGYKFYKCDRKSARISAQDAIDMCTDHKWEISDKVCPYMIVFENLAMGEAIYKYENGKWVADNYLNNQYKNGSWEVTAWLNNLIYKGAQASGGNY